MSQSTTAYLTEKCEVRNRDVAGGKAVYARELIEPGELIAVWSGRLVHADELDDLPEDIRHHTAQVEEDLYLASLSPDEPPDYINHSCEPNCYCKVIHGHILFFALRDIEPGEEITLDYGESYHSDRKRCSCGAPSCRGRINA